MTSTWYADSSIVVILKFETRIQIGYFEPPTILLPLGTLKSMYLLHESLLQATSQ